jgi:hypothetical protein
VLYALASHFEKPGCARFVSVSDENLYQRISAHIADTLKNNIKCGEMELL